MYCTMRGRVLPERIQDVPISVSVVTGDQIVKQNVVEVSDLTRSTVKAEIKAAYDAEVAAFRSGEKTMVTVFTGPISDNTGKVQIAGAPDIGKLYDDNGMWFASNVVGSTKP